MWLRKMFITFLNVITGHFFLYNCCPRGFCSDAKPLWYLEVISSVVNYGNSILRVLSVHHQPKSKISVSAKLHFKLECLEPYQ
jgi:hypothetical protein